MKKTIVITGASSGFGKETAKLFAKEGWNVAATMRSPEKETELNEYENIKVYKLDVTISESVNEAYKQIMEDFDTVDVLFNNAGYALSGPFELCSEEQIMQEFNVNVIGLMRMTSKFIPLFRSQGHGTIINVSSMGGKITLPLLSTYHSTKFVVEGFTESLGYELEQFGIKVKLIEPGSIQTNFAGSSMVFAARLAEESAYNEYIQKYRKLAVESASKGSYGTPEMLAEAVFSAATEENSSMRRVVGDDAHQLIGLKAQYGDDVYVKSVSDRFK